MWIDISLSITALAGVLYGIAGTPKSNGKLTKVGIGVISVAIIALALSIVKSVSDNNGKLAQEKKLVSLNSKIDDLKSQNEKVRKASIEAIEKATKLKSAIIAVFETIEVENDKLIMSLPTTIVSKRVSLFKTINKKVIKDQKSLDEIKQFQKGMDAVEQEIMGKVSQIESLFKSISND